MRTQRQATANPFAMMMDPQGVIDAVERSNPLGSLARRVCRPLDKPLIPKVGDVSVQDFDREIDAEAIVVADDTDPGTYDGAELVG
jgi:hypothetical protein